MLLEIAGCDLLFQCGSLLTGAISTDVSHFEMFWICIFQWLLIRNLTCFLCWLVTTAFLTNDRRLLFCPRRHRRELLHITVSGKWFDILRLNLAWRSINSIFSSLLGCKTIFVSLLSLFRWKYRWAIFVF